MEIKTTPVPKCPVCEGQGSVAIAGAHDHITKLPGTWTFRECSRCQTLWQDPCTVREDIGKLYPENYHFTHSEPAVGIKPARGFAQSAKVAILQQCYGYAGLPDGADSKFGTWFGRVSGMLGPIRRRAGRTTGFLRARKNGRLLDVGCGNGGFLNVMKGLGWECEGIEPDPIAAEMARRAGHKVREGSVEDLDLPESQYDAVSLSHVMEHFPQPRVAVARIERLLKPGGVLVSISPNPRSLIRRLYGGKWYGLMAPQHLVIPSANGYRILSELVGLQPKCWTSAANSYWYLRESISIKRTGTPGNCHSRLYPKLFSLASAMALTFFRNIGEEVICYAVKR